MSVADGNERRFITLPVEYWKYLEEKAECSKSKSYWIGRHTVSEEVKKMVKADMDMKKAGFLN